MRKRILSRLDDLDIDHEPIVNHADRSPHVSDKNLQVDPVIDPPMKGKSIEVNLPGSYRIGETVHPLFVSCLLDKIHRMEIELTEMVTRNDVIKYENLRLKEKADSDDKCVLHLKKHKNRLIHRVMKLQNDN